MAQSPLYFGGCVFSDDTQTTIVTGETFVKAANTTRGIGGHGFSHSDNRLTFDGHTGRTIEVTCTCSMVTSAATIARMAIFKNGVVVDNDATISRYVSVGTDVGAAAVSLITTAVKGDYFELWLTTNDGDEVTINSGTMIAKVIG